MLSREWLQAFVPVGVLVGANQWAAVGAGVLFIEHDLLWLVTAHHVVLDAGKDRIAPLLYKNDNSIVIVRLGEIHSSTGTYWIENEKMDLAATPLPTSPDFAIKAVSRRECIPLAEVIPSMPSYTVGCPYGVSGLDPSRPRPLVLDGVVSGINERESVIYTSAPTFPGNSGGPLVVYRNPFNPAGGLTIGAAPLLLAGIVLATNLVSVPSQAKGMPPLHLGTVRASEQVIALLDSAEARTLVDRLKGGPQLSAGGTR